MPYLGIVPVFIEKADCVWTELMPLICIAIVGYRSQSGQSNKTILPSLHSPVVMLLVRNGGMEGRLLSRNHRIFSSVFVPMGCPGLMFCLFISMDSSHYAEQQL